MLGTARYLPAAAVYKGYRRARQGQENQYGRARYLPAAAAVSHSVLGVLGVDGHDLGEGGEAQGQAWAGEGEAQGEGGLRCLDARPPQTPATTHAFSPDGARCEQRLLEELREEGGLARLDKRKWGHPGGPKGIPARQGRAGVPKGEAAPYHRMHPAGRRAHLRQEVRGRGGVVSQDGRVVCLALRALWLTQASQRAHLSKQVKSVRKVVGVDLELEGGRLHARGCVARPAVRRQELFVSLLMRVLLAA